MSENQKKYMDQESIHGPDNYKPLPVVLSEAKGVWVWDVLWVIMGKDAHMVCRGYGWPWVHGCAMGVGTWMCRDMGVGCAMGGHGYANPWSPMWGIFAHGHPYHPMGHILPGVWVWDVPWVTIWYARMAMHVQ